ncbi:MAG: hypothetical protein ACR2IH_05980 [Pyrinomonadaceae bacterium]
MISSAAPASWLAFDLNILRRIEFRSVAMPFTPDPALGVYLKRRDVRVLANDVLQSSWTKAVAAIQNNSAKLSDDDVNTVLEDIYVPRHRPHNPALRNWFGETDAWWFDNARQNIDKLQSPFAFAIAASLIMAVGDYALSFAPETLELRQPLSNVFRRLWMIMPEPVNNGQNNTCQNKNPDEFIAENFADLLFLRLPFAGRNASLNDHSLWREEWLRGGNDFWEGVESAKNGHLGMPIETKSQYLRLVEETLKRASNTSHWAIAHVETGFVSTQDVADVVSRIRRVEAIYTKDFSELTGNKAVIITA